MIAYIDAHWSVFGVEPICKALQSAPSASWLAKRRPRSQRPLRGEELSAEIVRVHAEDFGSIGPMARPR